MVKQIIEYIKHQLLLRDDQLEEVYIEPALYYKLEEKYINMPWGRVKLKCQR
jgi:hypothetical protein